MSAEALQNKYRSNGFLSQHSVYRGEVASVLDLQCQRYVNTWCPVSAASALETRNRQTKPCECRVEFSTGYPVVNGLRALASECRVEFSTGKRVPSQDSALEFQFWRSFSTGKKAVQH
ncbi:hypothetical protein Bbelb_073770 [Branchiostoma belcheri]|nr:hypothetical protein Bbelb_073770 [Branchiostoma belcheri]